MIHKSNVGNIVRDKGCPTVTGNPGASGIPASYQAQGNGPEEEASYEQLLLLVL